MFILAEMNNVVRVQPHLFHLKLNDAIAGELNEKLANKVVINVGLCICLYDITNIGDSYIFPGDGSSHTRVKFRYIVFRPFLDEILTGKIRSCSQDGVHGIFKANVNPRQLVTITENCFFDDILIPPNKLQYPSKFNEQEQVWVWEYDTGDGNKHDLYMDVGEMIRFRVIEEKFQETCPNVMNGGQVETSTDNQNKIPYSLIGAIDEPGLGLFTWWENN